MFPFDLSFILHHHSMITVTDVFHVKNPAVMGSNLQGKYEFN